MKNQLKNREICAMKHCVGLDYKKPYTRHGKKFFKPFRNRYFTYANDNIWNELVKKNLARCSDIIFQNGEATFWITRKGLDALGDAIGIHIYDEEG